MDQPSESVVAALLVRHLINGDAECRTVGALTTRKELMVLACPQPAKYATAAATRHPTAPPRSQVPTGLRRLEGDRSASTGSEQPAIAARLRAAKRHAIGASASGEASLASATTWGNLRPKAARLSPLRLASIRESRSPGAGAAQRRHR